jgi:CRISP-associated protein Cas1
MHAQPSAAPGSSLGRPDTGRPVVADRLFPATDSDVRVVDGYGVKVSVRHRHLVIEDGIGRQRRFDRYSRATCPFRRLLVVAHSGFITLDATRWCSDLGVEIVQLDGDQNLLLTTATRRVKTTRLRRSQALAGFTDLGDEAARLILTAKLRGQRELAGSLPGGEQAATIIDTSIERLQAAASVEDMMDAESTAAMSYWQCWATLPIRFAPKSRDHAPGHWRTFGSRSSLVSGTRRHASNPSGALLSYGYRLLEVETVLALFASGFDPSIGIWHRDEAGRHSFALDTMEAARPAVDRLVLDLLAANPLRPRDFTECSDGRCRLLPPMTHHLASWMPTLAWAVEPFVLQLGRLFDRTITTAPTLAVGNARRPEHRRTAHHTRLAGTPLRGCRTCGTVLPAGSRDPYCAHCAPERSTAAIAGHREAGSRVPQARRESLRRQRLAALEWERTHPEVPDPAEFTRNILPSLLRISYSALSRQTGLSRRYCKLIATGVYVPHPVHWEAFRSCAASADR